MRPSIAVEDAVAQLGLNLKNARVRRRLPQAVVAERAGISVNTLSKLENGDCGIALGNVAAVVNALGLTAQFTAFASSADDASGLLLEEKHLPKRVRVKRPAKPAA